MAQCPFLNTFLHRLCGVCAPILALVASYQILLYHNELIAKECLRFYQINIKTFFSFGSKPPQLAILSMVVYIACLVTRNYLISKIFTKLCGSTVR